MGISLVSVTQNPEVHPMRMNQKIIMLFKEINSSRQILVIQLGQELIKGLI